MLSLESQSGRLQFLEILSVCVCVLAKALVAPTQHSGYLLAEIMTLLVESTLLAVFVSPHQHLRYGLLCDTARRFDIQAAHSKPIKWLNSQYRSKIALCNKEKNQESCHNEVLTELILIKC